MMRPHPISYLIVKKTQKLKVFPLRKGIRHGHPLSSLLFIISSVQSLSCVWLCDSMDCRMPGLSVHHQLPEFAQTHVHWVSDTIQPSHPLSSPSPPAFNLSQHQVFSNEPVLCIRQPKYWSFSFNISPSNEYSGLIPLRWTGWISLQSKGLMSLLQHQSSKATIL